jgi:hypothetical protein
MMTRPLADVINGACANPTNLIIGGDPRDTKEKRAIGAALRAKLRNARRFYVDEDVTRAATRLGIQHPNVLLEMLRRARPPFEKIWIEWPLEPQIEESGQTIEEDAPVRTGCFVERIGIDQPIFMITPIAGPPANQPHDHRIGIAECAIIYDVQSPIAARPRMIEHQSRLANFTSLSEDDMARMLVGRAYTAFTPEDANEEEIRLRIQYCDQLSSHAAWIMNPMLRKWQTEVIGGKHANREFSYKRPGLTIGRLSAIDSLRSNAQSSIMEHTGQWRFVISLLALINNHEYTDTETTYRAGNARLVGGHVVAYMEHLLVKLKLPRRVTEERVLRDLTDVMGLGTRRHEVMGHFRQSRKKGDPNCDHAYIDVTPNRCRCTICGHSIWWVDEYNRGNAALGFIIKDRLVTRE